MRCGCCIELDTPQTIMDSGNEYYPEDTDVFEVIFSTCSQTFVNATVMKQALWWKWRDYCIGSCRTPEWVRGMADRLSLVGHKWDSIITKAYAEDTDLTSLSDRAYERIVTREGTDTNVNSTDGNNVTLSEHESLPQTETGPTRYLDARETVTSTPRVSTTDELTHDTKDTETYRADDTILAITFSEMLNNYPNVLLAFVSEFEGYFIDRWYL